jgi:hypothetical protein
MAKRQKDPAQELRKAFAMLLHRHSLSGLPVTREQADKLWRLTGLPDVPPLIPDTPSTTPRMEIVDY